MKRLLSFIKKYYLVLIIILLGIFFRLINLDKPGGLWYDEITIYSIASQKTFLGMIQADIHRFMLFPLYYLIYHIWITLFGNSDLVIRLMSMFFDTLSMIAAYFVGREFAISYNLNKMKLGTIGLLLYAINSLTIYYAQEAKFYSISLLLVNIVIFFWLKYLRQNSTKIFWWVCVSNLLLVLTYTSLSLLVIIIYIITGIYMYKSHKLIKSHLIIFPTLFIPIIIMCILIPGYFSGNFDAVVFDNSFILLLFQNFFSPVLNGLQNNILNYDKLFLKNLLNIKFIVFVIFPVFYILISQFKALKEYSITRWLLVVTVLFTGFHYLFTITSNYNVLVRYILPILPILLFISSIGIYKQNKKSLFVLFIVINLVYILSPAGAQKILRPDGYRDLAELLVQNNISVKSDFILPIRTNLLDKYFFITGSRFSLYLLNGEDAQKTYLTNEEISQANNDSTKNIAYKRYISDDTITKEFENFVTDNFVKNQSLVLIKDHSICMFSNKQLKQISQFQNYDIYPIQFIRMSKINNDLISVLKSKMKLNKNIIYKNWEIFVFEL